MLLGRLEIEGLKPFNESWLYNFMTITVINCMQKIEQKKNSIFWIVNSWKFNGSFTERYKTEPSNFWRHASE